MNTYVLQREQVRYTDGKLSPTFFYKGNLLGMNMLTAKVEDAAVFPSRSSAEKFLKTIGGRFKVVRI